MGLNIQKFYLLSSNRVKLCDFMDLRINSDVFPIQYQHTVCFNRKGGVNCAVKIENLNIIRVNFDFEIFISHYKLHVPGTGTLKASAVCNTDYKCLHIPYACHNTQVLLPRTALAVYCLQQIRRMSVLKQGLKFLYHLTQVEFGFQNITPA